MSNKWFEISLYDHWGSQPHGIARVTMNLFIESLSNKDVKYFYYCYQRNKFLTPVTIDHFIGLSNGSIKYDPSFLIESKNICTLLEYKDILIITGAGWGLTSYIDELVLFKDNFSVKLSVIIYDVIAIHSPHFFLESFANLVANFQIKLIGISDHIFSISQNTENDIKEILGNTNLSRTYSLIDMGFDFPKFIKNGSTIYSKSTNSQEYILCVGTIEARKNHLLLYFLMRKVCQVFKENAPKLIIVGKIGWLSDVTLEFMRRDPSVNSKIEILSDVDDEQLNYLYENSLFTIYPSYYEGYGLPILESLSRGKVCLCSDTSSMKEINPFKELTFNPYELNSVFIIVSNLLSNKHLLAEYELQIKNMQITRRWSDSFATLFNHF